MTEKQYNSFFHANYRIHLYFAHKVLPRDPMAAEDAVQVAYALAWQAASRGDFNGKQWGAMANWIRKTITNKIIDYCKHIKRGEEARCDIRYLSPEYIESAEIKSDLLNTYCNDLSRQEHSALSLYIDGYNYEDMAIALKININTARCYVKRGLDKIRVEMGFVKPPKTGADKRKGIWDCIFHSRQDKRLNPFTI
jgi:RNA polymerase sigma factor (sigma-70 family)